MFLTDEELAQIPIAPRVKANRPCTRPTAFRVAEDHALMTIARIVVAGINKRHTLHPNYRNLLEQYGKEKTHKLIEDAVALPGACDVIQTDMCDSGIGLFGGLAKDSSRFIFHEWSDGSLGTLSVSMTKQEVRDIVSGKKQTIIFRPEKFHIRLRIDPFKRREVTEGSIIKGLDELKRPGRSIKDERFYTKDINVWSLPYDEYHFENETKGAEEIPKFQVIIRGKPYNLAFSYIPNEIKWTLMILEIPPSMLSEIRQALVLDKSWKLRSRGCLYI